MLNKQYNYPRNKLIILWCYKIPEDAIGTEHKILTKAQENGLISPFPWCSSKSEWLNSPIKLKEIIEEHYLHKSWKEVNVDKWNKAKDNNERNNL